MQRNVHSSTIDGLVVSGLRPVVRGAGARSGARHRALPHAGGARSRARSDARARSARWSCRPPTSAPSPTCAGSPRWRTGTACRWSWTRRGAPISRSARRCPSTRSPAARTSSSRARTRSSAASPSRRCCTSGAGGRLDEHVVDRAITLLESTSPSSLLLGSLDAARSFAAVRAAPSLLAETVRSLAGARQAIRADPGPRRAGRAAGRAARRARLRPAATRRRRARHGRDRLPGCAH